MDEREVLEPMIGDDVYVDPSSILTGDVRLKDHSSVWPHAVLRGDINRIEVGEFSNIQDLCCLHVEDELPCIVGDFVTVGHNVLLHACTIGDHVLVGMGSIVLSGAKIEPYVILGAGTLVPEKAVLESGYVYYGSPAKRARELTEEEKKQFDLMARKYNRVGKEHLEGRYGRIGLTASPEDYEEEDMQ